MITKRWWASIGLALAMMLGVTACGAGEQPAGEEQGATSSATPSTRAGPSPSPGQDKPTPDLQGIPQVVAEVNGEKIGRDEFVLAYKSLFRQARRSGRRVDQEKLKQRVVENLVYSELLDQEAIARGFTASQEEVRSTLEDLARQYGVGSVQQLFAALKEQGLSRQQVLADVRAQVRVDKLLAAETGNLEPTEKQLRKLYDKAVALQQQSQQQTKEKQQPSSFEKVRPLLVKLVEQRQRNKIARELVQQLRKQAEVTIYL